MVADSFSENKRATAFAFFSAGANLGLFLAFLVGGVVASAYGWRMAFLIAGFPGLILTLVLMRSLREPSAKPSATEDGPTFLEVWRRLTAEAWVLAGALLTSTVNYGAIAWVATFLIRTHDLRIEQAGIYLAVVSGVGGAVVAFSTGVAADKLGVRNPAWRLILIALIIIIAKLLAIMAYTSEDVFTALLLLAFPAMAGGVYLGPTFAHLYSRISASERPQATAIILFLLNLVGLGLGPIIVGAISTVSTSVFLSTQGLALALSSLQVLGIFGALFFLCAASVDHRV